MAVEALHAHLKSGLTTVCQAWIVRRRDGQVFGFTDHDRDMSFDGVLFRADTGLTASALQQNTGLSVDNGEALGLLSDASIREADIAAGRFDGAEVEVLLVNWADFDARQTLFKGSLGEIRRGAGGFRAELRGLTERLNRPIGRVYQKPCTAVLGDASCRADLDVPGYRYTGSLTSAENGRVFSLGAIGGFDPGWFQRGRFVITSGAAQGLTGSVKHDEEIDGARILELWEPIRAVVLPGDMVTVEAGCDKRLVTCKEKFGNILNFQGFPDLPDEDWMMVHPTRSADSDGGSLR